MAAARDPNRKRKPGGRDWVRLGIAHRLNLLSGDSSNKEPGISSFNDTFPSTQSNIDASDNSLDTTLVRPFSRSQTRTFPQSSKEKVINMAKFPSIDATLGENGKGSTEVEYAVAHSETAQLRQLQPVPDDFQDLKNHPKKELCEKLVFDTQMRALELAVRSEQGGKQSRQDTKLFVEIWESRLLPKIEQVLDENVEGEYTVNVSRGPEPGERTIVIMTAVLIGNDIKRQLRESKSNMLPSNLDSTTIVMFRQGRVEFLADPETSLSRVSSGDSEDSCINPLNTEWSPDPAIGDSVGWKTESATLGPLLQIDEGFYRLICWHLFDDKGTNRRWDSAQPPQNLSTYCPSHIDSKDHHQHKVGDVVAYSGPMYNTSRLSVSINEGHVVTDWALVGSDEAIGGIPQPNIVHCRSTSGYIYNVEIKRDEDPASFLRTCEKDGLPPFVYSVGRTSGYTTGQLGLTHGRHRLSDGRKTKNWTVENVQPHNKKAVDEWIRAGMGVPGDSGAGVFGCWKNELLGQVWGRNTYAKNDQEPRFTFFTALADIYADIKEKMPGTSIVRLPTCSITDSIHSERDLAGHDTTWQTDDHSALYPNGEKWNVADLDEDCVDRDQEIKHRSAARSRRLGAVMAFGKKKNFFEPPGCQPFNKWAKVIIHAATF
ncbi:hypothetical protein F5Y12DRAFT_788678 [Xylaria sp. FL1777]|nr:hypothetical protein F5Y12DRAFT_788678 [Xylaria sp. FL1777]